MWQSKLVDRIEKGINAQMHGCDEAPTREAFGKFTACLLCASSQEFYEEELHSPIFRWHRSIALTVGPSENNLDSSIAVFNGPQEDFLKDFIKNKSAGLKLKQAAENLHDALIASAADSEKKTDLKQKIVDLGKVPVSIFLKQDAAHIWQRAIIDIDDALAASLDDINEQDVQAILRISRLPRRSATCRSSSLRQAITC